jgi:DNA-directed RNA polymerase subunit RPC12/RpoP
MSIVEVRCPNCGSLSSLINEKTREYRCGHCGASFFLINPTKKEIVKEIHTPNCPLCGRPIKIGEGFLCMECGKENLCSNCAWEIDERFVCKECARAQGIEVARAKPQVGTPIAVASQQQGAPVCPTCGGPLTYVQQYQRWYCYKDQKYV